MLDRNEWLKMSVGYRMCLVCCIEELCAGDLLWCLFHELSRRSDNLMLWWRIRPPFLDFRLAFKFRPLLVVL